MKASSTERPSRDLIHGEAQIPVPVVSDRVNVLDRGQELTTNRMHPRMASQQQGSNASP